MNSELSNNYDNKKESIVIDGASGYVGSHIASELSKLNFSLRCIVRSKVSEVDVQILENIGAQVYKADLGAPSSQTKLNEAFSGASTAIHTIGSVAPPKGETLNDLHVRQTASFVECCRRNHVRKIIMISSLGTRAQASAIYHKTKWLAEEIIRKSEIPFLILRPALIVGRIFGRRNSKLVDRYFKLIRDKQTVPLIAGGGNLVQPIFIADVVKAVLAGIAHSVEDKSIFGQSLDIGGPEQITMRNFVERMAIEVCGEKRNFRSISPLAAQMAAFFCEMVQDVPLISLDQVKLSAENNICHDNALESVLKVSPMSLSSAFASYIVHPINAQFDTPLKVS